MDEDSKKWAKRITNARDRHKKEVVRWFDKVKKEYSGDFENNVDTGEKYDHVCQVIHAIEETIQPHLTFVNPHFTCKAKGGKAPEWEMRERLVEAVINHEYQDVLPTGRKLEYENELVLVDARLLPYGVTKTEYFVEGEVIEEQDDRGLLGKVKDFFTGEEPELPKTPVITSEKGHSTERINPLKVFLDPTAENITRCKFIIEELDLTKEKLQNPRYDQAKVEKMKPTVALNDAKTSQYRNMDEFFEKNPDDSGYRVYELHDLEGRRIHTYSEELKDFIEFDREYPVAEGSQYSFLWFNDNPNSPYPVPPIKFYRKRALEFSYVHTQVSRQIDKFMPKIGVDGTKLSPEDKERLKSGSLGTLFETVGPPGAVAQQFVFGIQEQLFKYMALVKDMLNLESGVNDYETSSPEERKATEAVQIQQGTTARRFRPKKRVRDFLLNQANVILQTLQQNQTEERFVEVLGDEGSQWFNDPNTGKVSWTREQIAGNYNFTLDLEQATPMDSAMKKRQRMEAMQIILRPEIRQALMAEGKKLKLTPVFEKFVKEDLGVENRDTLLEDANILTAEQELVRLMYGQPIKVQRGEDMQSHLQGHMATLNAPLFKQMPLEVQDMLMGHIQETQQAFAQTQQQQGSGMPGPTSNKVPNKPSENEPLMRTGMEPRP